MGGYKYISCSYHVSSTINGSDETGGCESLQLSRGRRIVDGPPR